jgi:hypothetical protein
MLKRISRRTFLGAALAGFLGLAGLYAYEEDYRQLIVSIIRNKLSYLNLQEVDLYAFADEYTADKGAYGVRGRLFALAYPIIEHAGFLNPKPEATEMFENRVVSRFLLSTDFFWNESGDSRALRYRVYNNPHRVPCGNPFARFE